MAQEDIIATDLDISDGPQLVNDLNRADNGCGPEYTVVRPAHCHRIEVGPLKEG